VSAKTAFTSQRQLTPPVIRDSIYSPESEIVGLGHENGVEAGFRGPKSEEVALESIRYRSNIIWQH